MDEDAVPPELILVADDDPDLVALMSRRLQRAGYTIVTAADGEQALQMAQQFLPQLAIIDVMMPKLTGLDVIDQLKNEPATKEILVILISAGFDCDPTSGLTARADDYIKKPFGAQELPTRVRALLAR